MSILGICIAAIIGFGNVAKANVPVLEWDANPEPTVIGYNVYIGTSSGNYTRVVDVGPETRLPLTNFYAGVTHYLAVTAYDADRLESPFSDEVWYTPRVDGTNAIRLPFALDASSDPGSTPTIRFSGQPGQQCWIVASSDLEQWEQIYLTTFSNGSEGEFVDQNAQGMPMRFYQVIAGTEPGITE